MAEATMNAMEHGNRNQADVPVDLRVLTDGARLKVHIIDQGQDAPIPTATAPDLDAKLAGQQSPRGWGLFMIKNMVDEMNVLDVDGRHTLELVMRREDA